MDPDNRYELPCGILLEADFLVNADESEMSENAVETARERVFETNTGKKLLTSIYKLPAR